MSNTTKTYYALQIGTAYLEKDWSNIGSIQLTVKSSDRMSFDAETLRATYERLTTKFGIRPTILKITAEETAVELPGLPPVVAAEPMDADVPVNF